MLLLNKKLDIREGDVLCFFFWVRFSNKKKKQWLPINIFPTWEIERILEQIVERHQLLVHPIWAKQSFHKKKL